jgi:hypothetical protein
MTQLSKGDTFADGQQVTGVRLNGLVDNATVLPGVITDQINITANTVASDDSVLIHDLSATALREATVGDLLNSGLAITTGSVTGNAGADVVITPAATYKVDVAGPLEADSHNVTGNATVGGTLSITGTTTFTGAAIANGNFTCNGTANFTGPLQISGVGVGYFLGIVEENIPYATGSTANTLHTLFTSASYTKPTGEVWVVQLDATMWSLNNANTHYRLTNSADTTNFIVGYAATVSAYDVFDINKVCFLDSSSTHTGTFVLRAKCNQPTITISPNTTDLSTGTGYPDASNGSISKFRIYKYKTA